MSDLRKCLSERVKCLTCNSRASKERREEKIGVADNVNAVYVRSYATTATF